MPRNPEKTLSATDRIGVTVAKHSEIVLYVMGLVTGVLLVIVGGLVR